jgi:hypothetical protein
MVVKAVKLEWDAEAGGDLAERQRFAVLSAIRTLEAECALLLEASKLAHVAWRRACVQLAEFEALRDALDQQQQPFRYEPRREFLDAGTH